jgi:uncharacterized protein YuzE
MRYTYDKEHDALFLRFREGEYDESEEIYPGFVIDFDKNGRPLGLDLYYDASKTIDIEALKRNVIEDVYENEPMVIPNRRPSKT